MTKWEDATDNQKKLAMGLQSLYSELWTQKAILGGLMNTLEASREYNATVSAERVYLRLQPIDNELFKLSQKIAGLMKLI